MNPDQLIQSALSNAVPGMAEGAFIVEGHPIRKETRILPADEAMRINLNAFVWDINTGFICLGLFLNEVKAREFMAEIETGYAEYPYLLNGVWILEGSPGKNELQIHFADKAMRKNNRCYRESALHPYQYLGIYPVRTQAEQMIQAIRSHLRNELGERIEK